MVNRKILDEIDEMQKGWVDMIKSVVKATADLRLWKNGEPKPIDVLRVLGELSRESGIPLNVLFGWWKEEGGQFVEELTCIKCGRRPRYLRYDSRSGCRAQLYGENSIYWGLCAACRQRKQRKGGKT